MSASAAKVKSIAPPAWVKRNQSKSRVSTGFGVSCVGGGEEVAADRLAIADDEELGTKARVIDIAFAAFTLVDGTCRAGERTEEWG